MKPIAIALILSCNPPFEAILSIGVMLVGSVVCYKIASFIVGVIFGTQDTGRWSDEQLQGGCFLTLLFTIILLLIGWLYVLRFILSQVCDRPFTWEWY